MVKNMEWVRQDFHEEVNLTLKANLFYSWAIGIVVSPFNSSVKDGLKTLLIFRRGETPPRRRGVCETGNNSGMAYRFKRLRVKTMRFEKFERIKRLCA